jgi:hypothetical protein
MHRIHLFGALLVALAMTGTAAANPAMWQRQGWAETDFSRHSVPFSEILSGGPPKDGIPSIDEPRFRPAGEIDDIADNEPVIRLEVNGGLRAYPLRVLTWHEIANDVVGGVPVAVTYCPLCNAALVFRRVVAGEPTTFGTTGMLRHSDLVMYDRKTESWWQQFTGEAIVGERTGEELEMVPSRIVSFGDFRDEAPDGKVLVPEDPDLRAYGRNPYVSYDSRSLPYPFFKGEMPEGIGPMERVVVVRDGGGPKAVRLTHLREEGEVRLGDVTLRWQPGVSSALDSGEIAQGRDVGTVRATRTTPDGAQQDVVHDTTFAFAFHAFHPEAEILGK